MPTSAGPSSRLHGLVPIRITISSIVHSSSLEHCSRYRTVDSSDIFQRYSPRAAYFLVVLHISYLGCTGRASDRWRSPAASKLFTGAFQLHAICFRLTNTGGEFIQTSSIASSIGYIQVCIHLRNQGARTFQGASAPHSSDIRGQVGSSTGHP